MSHKRYNNYSLSNISRIKTQTCFGLISGLHYLNDIEIQIWLNRGCSQPDTVITTFPWRFNYQQVQQLRRVQESLLVFLMKM